MRRRALSFCPGPLSGYHALSSLAESHASTTTNGAPSLATTRQRAGNAAASSGQARLGRRAPHGQPPYTGDVLPTRQPFHGFADRNRARSLGDHGRIRMWYSAQGFSERCTPLMPRSTPAGRVRGVRPLRMPVDAARGDDLPKMWLPAGVRVVLPCLLYTSPSPRD